MPDKSWQIEGTTGGFHYGTIYAPCNGVLHATLEAHTDGRQVFVCDACGSQCVMKQADIDRLNATQPD